MEVVFSYFTFVSNFFFFCFCRFFVCDADPIWRVSEMNTKRVLRKKNESITRREQFNKVPRERVNNSLGTVQQSSQYFSHHRRCPSFKLGQIVLMHAAGERGSER
jgi:hypothetical protein